MIRTWIFRDKCSILYRVSQESTIVTTAPFCNMLNSVSKTYRVILMLCKQAKYVENMTSIVVLLTCDIILSVKFLVTKLGILFMTKQVK